MARWGADPRSAIEPARTTSNEAGACARVGRGSLSTSGAEHEPEGRPRSRGQTLGGGVRLADVGALPPRLCRCQRGPPRGGGVRSVGRTTSTAGSCNTTGTLDGLAELELELDQHDRRRGENVLFPRRSRRLTPASGGRRRSRWSPPLAWSPPLPCGAPAGPRPRSRRGPRHLARRRRRRGAEVLLAVHLVQPRVPAARGRPAPCARPPHAAPRRPSPLRAAWSPALDSHQPRRSPSARARRPALEAASRHPARPRDRDPPEPDPATAG